MSGSRSEAVEVGSSTGQLPACPLCGHRRWQGPARGTPFFRCPNCALWFHARSVDRAEEERLYDHCDSVPVQDQEAIAQRYWALARRLAATRGRPLQRVLDVGCGSGHFLLQAREHGAEVAGLELDPAQVRACLEQGLPVRSGSLFDVGVPSGPWDLVTFWDVLDHLEEPVEALRRVLREVPPGGLVVARGRNAAVHVPLKIRHRRYPHWMRRLRVPDVSVVHRWGFTPPAWKKLFAAAGLENVRLIAGVPTPGDRYRMLGAGAAALLKGGLGSAAQGLCSLTGGRTYYFPSVLIVGERPLGGP